MGFRAIRDSQSPRARDRSFCLAQSNLSSRSTSSQQSSSRRFELQWLLDPDVLLCPKLRIPLSALTTAFGGEKRTSRITRKTDAHDPHQATGGELDPIACETVRLTLWLKSAEGRMSRMTVLVLAVLGSLYLPGQALAQLTPLAGSAGRAIRRSAACRLVLPIPGSSRTPAASETPQVCRRSAATRRYPWSPQHRRHRHGSSRRLLIRARRSGSSTRMP